MELLHLICYNGNVDADNDVNYDEDWYNGDDGDDLGLKYAFLPSVCTSHALIIYLLLQHFVELSFASSTLQS